MPHSHTNKPGAPHAGKCTVERIVHAMETLAPPILAEPWDNVGLLLGSPNRALNGPVLLTIDLSEPVADEAVERGCCAIIAYHPPIFHPIKRLTGGNTTERIILKLLASPTPAVGGGIAVYSPHTALDAAEGGVTDWLADGLLSISGAGIASQPSSTPGTHAGADRRALRAAGELHFTQEVKVVTFLPTEAVEKVRAGLASAGAGLIGKYELCSFTSTGHGTFRGLEGSNPAVGQAGHLEHTHEQRLEMVCSRRALPLAIETLRQFHPYEEPAIDVYELQPIPTRSVGAGRRVTLDHPTPLAELARRLKNYLKTESIAVAPREASPALDPEKLAVSRVAVVPGSGGELAALAMADGCELFVTGEMKHHEIRAAVSGGMSVILAGHTETERGFLPTLQSRLSASLPGTQVLISTRDRPALTWCR